MSQSMFSFKHVKPTTFSTPNLVRLDGFRTAATPDKGFVFKPLFATPSKPAGWKDIEAVTGKKFTSYEAAIKYVNDLQHGKAGGHTGSGFISNLFNDVTEAVPGIATGLYQLGKGTVQDVGAATGGDFSFKHDVGLGKNIAASYKQTYSPLLHGHFSQFWDNVYDHPFGPILDVATVFTGGAGAVVKGAKLLSEGSALARLGETQPLLARSAEAIRLGEKATPENSLLHRMTSGNPVIRTRQKVVYKMTNNLPRGIGAKLEERRYTARQVKINTHKDKAREIGIAKGAEHPAIAGYQKAMRGSIFQKHLTPHQMAAGHILDIVGTHMSVADAIKNGARIATEQGFQVPKETMALWEHPKTVEALTKAVADFKAGKENRVLTFRNMVNDMGQVDAVNKGVHPGTIETAKWGALADLSSDHVVKGFVDTVIGAKNSLLHEDPKYAGQLNQARLNVQARVYVAARNEGLTMRQFIEKHGNDPQTVDRLYAPVDPKLVDKGAHINDAPVIRAVNNGDSIDPIYVPHKSNEKAPTVVGAVPRGQGDLLKANHHVMLALGRVAIGEDLIGPEFARTLRIQHANDIYEAHIAASVKVAPEDVSQMIASGYKLVKAPEDGRDFLTETSSKFLDRVLTQADEKSILESIKGLYTSKDNPVTMGESKGLLKDGDKYLMIRETTSNHLAQEYVASSKIIKQYVDRPLNLWKYVVLGLSPRNIVTNVVGNTLMAAVMANGPVGAMRIVVHSALKSVLPEKITAAISFKGVMGISDRFMQQAFPEHWQATFAHGEMKLTGKAHAFAFSYRASHRNEIALRQGMFMELIRNDPVIRDIMKRRKKHGGGASKADWEAAAEEAFKQSPYLRMDMSDRVDDALGNYRDFSHTENIIRKVMPFYSWYRHASRTGHALTKRPTTVNVGYNLGVQGQAQNQSVFGDVPEFMRSFVPIGKNEDGAVQALNTSGLNPFNALTEMASAGKNLLVSKDKAGSAGKIATFLNPFGAAGIEELQGTSLLTGAPSKAPDLGQPNSFLPNLLARVVGGTPQARLGEAYNSDSSGGASGLDLLTPTGQLKKPHVGTLSKGARTQTYNFLGFPTKDVNVSAAQEWQKTLEKDNTYHLPKPRKKKPKKYKLDSLNFGAK